VHARRERERERGRWGDGVAPCAVKLHPYGLFMGYPRDVYTEFSHVECRLCRTREARRAEERDKSRVSFYRRARKEGSIVRSPSIDTRRPSRNRFFERFFIEKQKERGEKGYGRKKDRSEERKYIKSSRNARENLHIGRQFAYSACKRRALLFAHGRTRRIGIH